VDDRERIAYLHDLATSHFNDGNLAAAVSAWEQVLAVDKGNVEAQKGITLAKRKLAVAQDIARHEAAVRDDDPLGAGPSLGGGGPFDADATVMFSAGSVPGPAATQAFNPDATITFNPAAMAAMPVAAANEDRTMVFNAATMAPSAPQAQPLDEDRTMLFTPGQVLQPPGAGAPPPSFDAERTVMFNPAQVAPPAPAAAFDAERTVMFNPAAAVAPPPAAPAPARPAEDEDRTIVFAPGAEAWAPPVPATPAAPAWAPPAPPVPAQGWAAPAPPAAPDADATILSADIAGIPAMPPPPMAPAEAAADRTMVSPDAGGFDFALPPPPPPPAAPAPAPRAAAAASKNLEEFVLPTGGLEMAGPTLAPPPAPVGPPPAAGKPAEAPGGWGFSFELPPPPAAGPPPPATPSIGLPALPSLGIPSPPPAAPRAGKAASARFGEVDPGEIESLSVPVVSPAAEAPPMDEADKHRREEELKERYARQFGRGPVTTAPAAAPVAPAPTTNWMRLLVIGGVAMAVVSGGAWLAIRLLAPPPPPVVERPKETHVEKALSPEEAEVRIGELQRQAEALMQQGDMEKAGKVLQDARDVATKAGVASPALDKWNDLYDQEVKFQKRLQAAIVNFCRDDYSRQTLQQFQELQVQRPDDDRAARFIVSLYYNAGVQELQFKRPWEASWYFEQVLARSPGDAEAGKLKEYSARFSDGTELGEDYLGYVDRLGFRRTGCSQ
jgi:hypothetical protein